MKKIGYILTHNFCWKSFKFEINKEYKFKAKGKSKFVFEYYKNPSDTLEHYYISSQSSILLKVEILGDVKEEDGILATNHIKVLEIIDVSKIKGSPINTKTPLCEYDDNNNLIHYKDLNVEYWQKYDQNNNVIYYKHLDFEEWSKYDSNNNVIHHKKSNGFECWQKFNEDICISYKNTKGVEWELEIK